MTLGEGWGNELLGELHRSNYMNNPGRLASLRCRGVELGPAQVLVLDQVSSVVPPSV